MADLRKFVKNVVEETLKSKYPYALYPSVVLGRIVAKRVADAGFVYTVCVLSTDGEKDSEYPEIPNVWSDTEFEINDDIAAAFLNKRQRLYIIGRVMI